MATYHVVYWREIPSMVQARDAHGSAGVPLGPRFQELIDAVAMREGLAEQDSYLAQWRNGPRAELPGSAEEVARKVAAELEGQYEELRRRLLPRAPA